MSDFNPYVEWLGIPAPGNLPDHYALLGIPRFEADQEAIRRAADAQKSRVRSIRPGEHAADWGRILDELDAAQKCLTAAGQKTAYDKQLRQTALDRASPNAQEDPSRADNESGSGQSAQHNAASQAASSPIRNLLPPGIEGPDVDKEELVADEAAEPESEPVESLTKNLLPPTFPAAASPSEAPAPSTDPGQSPLANPAPLVNPAQVVNSDADAAVASDQSAANPAPIVTPQPSPTDAIYTTNDVPVGAPSPAGPGQPAFGAAASGTADGFGPGTVPSETAPNPYGVSNPNAYTPPSGEAEADDDLLPPMAVPVTQPAAGATPAPTAIPANNPGGTAAPNQFGAHYGAPGQHAPPDPQQSPHVQAPGMQTTGFGAPVGQGLLPSSPPTGMAVPTGVAIPGGMPIAPGQVDANTNLAGPSYGSAVDPANPAAPESSPFGSDTSPFVSADSSTPRTVSVSRKKLPASTVAAIVVSLLLVVTAGAIFARRHFLGDSPVTLAGDDGGSLNGSGTADSKPDAITNPSDPLGTTSGGIPVPVPVPPPDPMTTDPDPMPPDPMPMPPDPMPMPPDPIPIPPEPVPMPDPLSELTTAERQKIKFHLDQAKTSMAERDIRTARAMIKLAENLADGKRIGPHSDKIERMALLTDLVTEFWGAVDDSIRDLAGQDLEVGSTVVHIQSVSRDSMSYRMTGKNFRKPRHEWPAGLVRAIAERWLDKNAKSKLFVGAFMAVEPSYRRLGTDKAREQWLEAQTGPPDVVKSAQKIMPVLEEL